MLRKIWKQVISLGVAHEEGEWVAVLYDVEMNVQLKFSENAMKLDLAYVECKGWASIADGVMIGSDHLRNVAKQKIVWMESGWVAMADDVMIPLLREWSGVMIRMNPLWNVSQA